MTKICCILSNRFKDVYRLCVWSRLIKEFSVENLRALHSAPLCFQPPHMRFLFIVVLIVYYVCRLMSKPLISNMEILTNIRNISDL